MDKDYYILSEENPFFPKGCIFEMTGKEKLLCLDNNKICENLNRVIDNCKKIDRKSTLLLQPVSLVCRLQLWSDQTWKEMTKLDVADECFYIMTGHEMPCKIISKQLGDKGLSFTIEMESGKRCNLNIDRLRIKKEITINDSVPSVKSRISTWANRSVTVYDQIINKDATSNCKCLSNILKKAHALELSLNEKELLFRHLFSILPTLPDDDEGRCSLHWACYYLLTDSVTALLNVYGGKDKQDKQGNVPLYLAINSPLIVNKEAKSLEKLEKVIIILLAHGANINIRNNQNETPLMKIFKNGNFHILMMVFENYSEEFRLSDHLLPDKASILELLIKMKELSLASLCCKKCRNDEDQNEYYLKSAHLALINGSKTLCVEILEKSSNLNDTLQNGEIFLTQILNDLTINSENICFILNSISFKFDKCNRKYEHSLSLACRRLLVDVVKLIFNKSFVEVSKLNDAIEETVNAYTEMYINFVYKSIRPGTFQSINQVKQVAIEILDLLLKNGANIETMRPSVINSIENCVDNEFVKVVKYMCRIPSMASSSAPPLKDSIDSAFSFSQTIQSTNQCSICMDRIINCAFSCGHTCCFECGNKLSECHNCRNPIVERRKIFIS